MSDSHIPSSSQQHMTHTDYSRDYAVSLDSQDALRHSRNLFHIPRLGCLGGEDYGTPSSSVAEPLAPSYRNCVYLCGNSLGLQPRLTAGWIEEYLATWATHGVAGHFMPLARPALPKWIDADAQVAERIAPIVGALPTEVAVMQTLTANLHLLLSAFYKPDITGRHMIIIENQAFPSDHFVAESQIKHHNLNPETSLIKVTPQGSEHTISTEQIISVIEEYKSTAAILLLPGIQYYTGQFLDIPTINTAARNSGIFVIWDLAHAVANVNLKLHEWEVDAAVWCSYKYLNGGPGTTGGMFIHEKHSRVLPLNPDNENEKRYVNRLSGWWGSQKASRFKMDNIFEPIPGAAGFQLSNPSIFDNTSILASLEVFSQVCNWNQQASAMQQGITPLRNKSIKLTNYLEAALENMEEPLASLFKIITPKDPAQRGAQLSIKLKLGILSGVMEELERRGVVVDERQPDVIRVAPAPLYNTFEDCWCFVQAFREALAIVV